MSRGFSSGPHRGSGQKFQKTQHDKAKTKEKKKKSEMPITEESPALSISEIYPKTITSLEKLGTQIFALSPFSQYYDDWLVSLKQVVFEFETASSDGADEEFVKERTQIFQDVERELAEIRLKEGQMEQTTKQLSEKNHLLVETDANYAHQTHELAAKRNTEIERLTKKVHDLEEELNKVKQMKTSFFGFTKKAKARKEEATNQTLNAAKTELEVNVENFKVEQEKLHDEYEKSKQSTIEKVQSLEKEIANIESDGSVETRQKACNALIVAVRAIVQRREKTPQTPA